MKFNILQLKKSDMNESRVKKKTFLTEFKEESNLKGDQFLFVILAVVLAYRR